MELVVVLYSVYVSKSTSTLELHQCFLSIGKIALNRTLYMLHGVTSSQTPSENMKTHVHCGQCVSLAGSPGGI